jgi:hypothetical protein
MAKDSLWQTGLVRGVRGHFLRSVAVPILKFPRFKLPGFPGSRGRQ